MKWRLQNIEARKQINYQSHRYVFQLTDSYRLLQTYSFVNSSFAGLMISLASIIWHFYCRRIRNRMLRHIVRLPAKVTSVCWNSTQSLWLVKGRVRLPLQLGECAVMTGYKWRARYTFDFNTSPFPLSAGIRTCENLK